MEFKTTQNSSLPRDGLGLDRESDRHTYRIEARPNCINKVHVPKIILHETSLHFIAHGRQQECYVLWSGKLQLPDEAHITRCIHPVHGSTIASISIDLEENFRIQKLLANSQEFLFAQVHTHPGEAFHSFMDNHFPFSRKPGFFSIVVPRFGQNQLDNLGLCQVYEYIGEGKWKQLSKREVAVRFPVQ